ncbi:unnamed protein product [Tuber melanosporum]|uniref:(Perigord truffle) hypothetical protein n=1 Tax=Tuber melanosporum (strain Mel28) TaxID=656061 RepID=D5GMX9_TUBMM|nr:uncharacterized protein GSTUM_00010989001 [Tuber melanosporum]CAZ85872.1 unnamed protein product [Tuber melanosporum]
MQTPPAPCLQLFQPLPHSSSPYNTLLPPLPVRVLEYGTPSPSSSPYSASSPPPRSPPTSPPPSLPLLLLPLPFLSLLPFCSRCCICITFPFNLPSPVFFSFSFHSPPPLNISLTSPSAPFLPSPDLLPALPLPAYPPISPVPSSPLSHQASAWYSI